MRMTQAAQASEREGDNFWFPSYFVSSALRSSHAHRYTEPGRILVMSTYAGHRSFWISRPERDVDNARDVDDAKEHGGPTAADDTDHMSPAAVYWCVCQSGKDVSPVIPLRLRPLQVLMHRSTPLCFLRAKGGEKSTRWSYE